MKAITVIVFFIIVLTIAIPVYLLKRFISKKISDGVDNAFESVSAHRRNKKLQNQGSQSLADKFAQSGQPIQQQYQQPQQYGNQPQQYGNQQYYESENPFRNNGQ